VCTVLLRWQPTAPWPVLLAAVRDEFLARPWDPPGAHWPDHPGVLGGRDRLSGGTWLAVDPAAEVVAAVLNGPPLPPAERPTRGSLPLLALLDENTIPPDIDRYDTFHLLRVGQGRAELWSWDGDTLRHQPPDEGDHIVVNHGLDATTDPLVPHFAPLFAALPDPPLQDSAASVATKAAWGAWVELLRGDGLDPGDPRALLIEHEFDGRRYGSGSATLVGLSAHAVRYDFTAHPSTPDWAAVSPT
jgi:hypothetical protein